MMDADGRPELVRALRELGLAGEASPFGRWIRIWGAHGPVYVAQAAFGRGYYTWDDAAHRRRAGPYDEAREAIRVGLRRAAQAQGERAAAQREREGGQDSQPGQEKVWVPAYVEDTHVTGVAEVGLEVDEARRGLASTACEVYAAEHARTT